MRRCEITKNPCGTDTRPAGLPCLCKECAAWLVENQQPPDANMMRVWDENAAELYES